MRNWGGGGGGADMLTIYKHGQGIGTQDYRATSPAGGQGGNSTQDIGIVTTPDHLATLLPCLTVIPESKDVITAPDPASFPHHIS